MSGSIVATGSDGLPIAVLDQEKVISDARALVNEIINKADDSAAVGKLVGAVSRIQGDAAPSVFGLALIILVNPVISSLVEQLEEAGVDRSQIRSVVGTPFWKDGR